MSQTLFALRAFCAVESSANSVSSDSDTTDSFQILEIRGWRQRLEQNGRMIADRLDRLGIDEGRVLRDFEKWKENRRGDSGGR